jgi:hypothetical protein
MSVPHRQINHSRLRKPIILDPFEPPFVIEVKALACGA